jgi:hypothetical protein
VLDNLDISVEGAVKWRIRLSNGINLDAGDLFHRVTLP